MSARAGLVRMRHGVRPRRAGYGSRIASSRCRPVSRPTACARAVQRMRWYHEIDLGDWRRGRRDGKRVVLMTSRAPWELFALGDLAGRSVLDIGGIDGAYAFRPSATARIAWRCSTAICGRRRRPTTPRIYHEHVDRGVERRRACRTRAQAWRRATRIRRALAVPTTSSVKRCRRAEADRARTSCDCDLAATGRADVVAARRPALRRPGGRSSADAAPRVRTTPSSALVRRGRARACARARSRGLPGPRHRRLSRACNHGCGRAVGADGGSRSRWAES